MFICIINNGNTVQKFLLLLTVLYICMLRTYLTIIMSKKTIININILEINIVYKNVCSRIMFVNIAYML